MATIIRFAIPTCVESVMADKWDFTKVVNAVQAELNAGTILKTSTKSDQDWKTVKDDNGNERLVIHAKTKTGERIQLENGKGNRFYAWCNATVKQQSFGESTVTIPRVYTDWMDSFAKLVPDAAKAK